jgi:hypothetical protein
MQQELMQSNSDAPQPSSLTALSRRRVLGASASALAAVALLAACGDDNDGSDGPSASTAPPQPLPEGLAPKELSPIDVVNVGLLQVAYGIQLAAIGIYTTLKDTKVRPDGTVVLGGAVYQATDDMSGSTTTTTLPAGSKALFSPLVGPASPPTTDNLVALTSAAIDRASSIHTTHKAFLAGYVSRFRVPVSEVANPAILESARGYVTKLTTSQFANDQARIASALQGAALLRTIEGVIVASYLDVAQQIQLGGTKDVELPASSQYRVAVASCGSVSARIETYLSSLLGTLELTKVFQTTEGSVV